MLVKADGTALGTVGGGAVEYQVTLACREAVKSKESSLREFTLTRGKYLPVGKHLSVIHDHTAKAHFF